MGWRLSLWTRHGGRHDQVDPTRQARSRALGQEVWGGLGPGEREPQLGASPGAGACCTPCPPRAQAARCRGPFSFPPGPSLGTRFSIYRELGKNSCAVLKKIGT